jgi:uncharacterized protein (DUF362 family)
MKKNNDFKGNIDHIDCLNSLNSLSNLNRRDFIKKGLAIGGLTGLYLLNKNYKSLFAQTKDAKSGSVPDLVAVNGGEPDKMFDLAIKALGGMKKFVRKGQTVVVKPNIGWNRTVEYGANTNPGLVSRIIQHCLEAGAKKVYVFDHPCDFWTETYKNSGIEEAAKNAGAVVVPADKEGYYQLKTNNSASILKSTKIHELILESDVFINVPVLKNHGSSRLTIAMKNLMGIVWDRGFFHDNGLHECIAESCMYRKPDLNIVDAYRVMLQYGPRGGSTDKEAVAMMKSLLISTDIVAIDAAGAKLFGADPAKIKHIKYAHDKKIGNMNLDALNIKKISI